MVDNVDSGFVAKSIIRKCFMMKVKGKWSKAANYASWLRLVMVMDGLEELEQEEEEEEGDVA